MHSSPPTALHPCFLCSRKEAEMARHVRVGRKSAPVRANKTTKRRSLLVFSKVFFPRERRFMDVVTSTCDVGSVSAMLCA